MRDLKRSWLTSQRVRWFLAALVALAAVGFFVIGMSQQTLCEDKLVQASDSVVKMCGAPGLTQLLPFVLLIAVLLAPDLRDFELVGVFKASRLLKAHGQELGEIRDRVEETAAANAAELPYPPDLRAAAEGIERKEQEVRAAPADDPGTAALQAALERASQRRAYTVMRETRGEEGRLIDPENRDPDALLSDLAYLWKNIHQYEGSARVHRLTGERMAHLDEERQQAVERWASLFEDEIRAVRTIWMRTLTEPEAVSVESLQDAVRTGRELLRILQAGLDLPT